MAKLAPRHLPPRGVVDRPRVFPAEGKRVKRVALLAGCVQKVLSPAIDDATMRLLTRHGCEVVVAEGSGCCGGIVHHMGRDSLDFVTGQCRCLDARTRTATGSTPSSSTPRAAAPRSRITAIMLREDVAYAAKAAKIARWPRT